jgi:uncharacterized membrane protein
MNDLSTTSFKNLEVNVGAQERIVSVVSGSVLLYNSLTKKPKSIPRALLAGFMIFRGATGHCPAYKLIGKKAAPVKVLNVNIKVSMTIDKPVPFVYQFWRKLENLPLFMEHLESVTVLDEETSEWKAKIPGNLGNLTWKASIIKDEENREISWRSFSDALIHNVGKVEFHDNGSFGTKMYVVISYRAPLGKPGETAAKVLNPIFENMVEEDIKRFKEYVENK